MSALKILLECLRSRKETKAYYIPNRWNYINFAGTRSPQRTDEICVEPCGFYAACIEGLLSRNAEPRKREATGTVLYSMFPRLFSAWMHGEDGTIDNGTFLKSLCLLPLLKDMGIHTVYLLPFFESGERNRKGELASPYSIRDIMKIDPNLHDSLLGDEISAQTEFQAFVEACHLLGMNVMADFVLRTVSRDNVLIEEHPEWFYWIHAECEETFRSPGIAGVGQTVVSADTAPLLYQSPEMETFIRCFAEPPQPEEWKSLRAEAGKNGTSVFDLLANRKGIIVMPGFADTINDPQPPWTDITFPKFYFDQTENAQKYLDVSVLPPFVAQDGVKCSVCPCSEPNYALWNYMKNVIPYYIRTYGIDGARIDMAHALPTALNDAIIREIKALDPEFLLWSEEFFTKNASKAKKEGYTFITGGIWDLWDNTNSISFNPKFAENLTAALPAVSALEMADTPRSALSLQTDLWEPMLLLTALAPNNVLLINNGEELGEIQPMNLGLKNTEQGRYVLPPEHPLYGKLAFFDACYLNWKDDDRRWEKIALACRLRERFYPLINNAHCCDWKLFRRRAKMTVLCAKNEKTALFAVFNRGSTQKYRRLHWEDLPEGICRSADDMRLVYAYRADREKIGPYGVIIFEMAVD